MNSLENIIIAANKAYEEGDISNFNKNGIIVFNSFNTYPSALPDASHLSILGELYLNLAEDTISPKFRKICLENGLYCMLKEMKSEHIVSAQRAAILLFLFIAKNRDLVAHLCAMVYDQMLDIIMGGPVHPIIRNQIKANSTLGDEYSRQIQAYCISIFKTIDTHLLLSEKKNLLLKEAMHEYQLNPAPEPWHGRYYQFPKEYLWTYLTDEINMTHGIKESRITSF